MQVPPHFDLHPPPWQHREIHTSEQSLPELCSAEHPVPYNSPSKEYHCSPLSLLTTAHPQTHPVSPLHCFTLCIRRVIMHHRCGALWLLRLPTATNSNHLWPAAYPGPALYRVSCGCQMQSTYLHNYARALLRRMGNLIRRPPLAGAKLFFPSLHSFSLFFTVGHMFLVSPALPQTGLHKAVIHMQLNYT